jgi:hypothetical protein
MEPGSTSPLPPKLQEQLDTVFRYHIPSAEQVVQSRKIREAAKAFAEVVARECPQSADRTAAFRKIREAMMTANAAIACSGVHPS